MGRRRAGRAANAVALGVTAALGVALGRPARAQVCRAVSYAFQPVAYDADHEIPPGVATGLGALEEGGPQIAIWLETAPAAGSLPAARGSFVADLFVTARTATFGIGNRAGDGMFPSSPRFPYGARDSVLPVWALARGHGYPLLVMQNGNQESFRFHNAESTVDDFFCRPLLPSEIVDALTCPTAFFNSDKGMFDPGGRRVLYPPRHDVAAAQCRLPSGGCTSGCDSVACTMLADLDDLAAVSGATPSPFAGVPTVGTWRVPDGLADGEYVVLVEVSKQYDQDAPRCPSGLDADCPPEAPLCDPNSRMCARHPAVIDNLGQGAYGLGNNLGQPSVVWAARARIDSAATRTALGDDAIGYGPWDHPADRPPGGDAGWAFGIHPLDATISTRPGSGAARLARITDGDGSWRLKVTAGPCTGCAAAVAPPPLEDLRAIAPDGNRIEVEFTEVGVGGRPVASYEIRYVLGPSLDAASFAAANPAPAIVPGAPGTPARLELGEHEGIQAQRTFTIGARAVGDCGAASALRTATVTTPRQSYRTVDGCFLATAAWGTPLAPELWILRAARDRLLLPHPVGRAAVGLYYGASPPLARALAGSPIARLAVRALLRPVVEAARVALAARAATR